MESKVKHTEGDNLKKKTYYTLHSALDCLLTKDTITKIRFARQRVYEHGDKPGKYLEYLTEKKLDF